MFKVKINLIDQTLAGCRSWVEGSARCGTSQENHRSPELVEYVRDQSVWDGITLFTDKTLSLVDSVQSPIKVGVIMECRTLDPIAYRNALEFKDKFDYIFTHDSVLLELDPEKFKFIAADTICIDTPSMCIHEKTKMVSMTYSTKTFLPGHSFRHSLVKQCIPQIEQSVDLYGEGTGVRLQMKSDALRDYRFSIEVENDRLPNYFTEKLLDCFSTGTIPIYWGCPNIEDFFNVNGILQFSSAEEFTELMNNLTPELYEKKKMAVLSNYYLVMKRYLQPDDNIYKRVMEYEKQRV